MGNITGKTDLKVDRYGSIAVTPRTDNGEDKRDTNPLDDGNWPLNNPKKTAEPHARQLQLIEDGEGIRRNIEDQISRQSNPAVNGNSPADGHQQTATNSTTISGLYLPYGADPQASGQANNPPPDSALPPPFNAQSRSPVNPGLEASGIYGSQNPAGQTSDDAATVEIDITLHRYGHEQDSGNPTTPGQAFDSEAGDDAIRLPSERPQTLTENGFEVHSHGPAVFEEGGLHPAPARSDTPGHAGMPTSEDGPPSVNTGNPPHGPDARPFAQAESPPARYVLNAQPHYDFRGAVDFLAPQAQTAASPFSNPHQPERGVITQGVRGQLLDSSGFAVARSIVDYLNGSTGGGSLPPDVRRTLDQTVMVVGREAARGFVEKHGERAVTLVERYIKQATETLNPLARHEAASAPAALEQNQTRRVVDQLTHVLQLSKQFDKLERVGGRIVRQAEAAAISFLSGGTRGGQRPSSTAELMAAAELRRDLSSGAFLPAYELHNPFPLTGRARVVTEMMELMRTLDAIDRALRQLEGLPRSVTVKGEGNGTLRSGPTSDLLSAALLVTTGHGEAAPGGEVDFSGTMPALPGRAGRDEIARFLSSLNLSLTDASGEALLVAEDKTPLKLDELLWLGGADGAPGSAFEADDAPTRLSPLLLYGFDAVYSLIGFDGRTLAAPHFATIQAQINGSEFEWVLGQPPLSESWTRAMIERLKDSISVEHNVLGETLEEALTNGLLHTLVIHGAVEQGVAVGDSFALRRSRPESSFGAAQTYAHV